LLRLKAGDWRKLAGLDWGQRRDLAEAWLRVIRASVVLRRRGAKTLERVAGSVAATGTVGNGDLDRARALARLVDAAASRSPVRTRCLERSVALSGMLARRGIPAVLRIGVRRTGADLEAHAWVECAGASLDPEHPESEPFEAFPAGFVEGSQKKNNRSFF